MLRNPEKANDERTVISDTQVFVRSRAVVSRVVAGETLIVPVRGKVGDLASIYSFNGTGSLIWQSLDSPASLADLTSAVEREYAIDSETARRDVIQFLADLPPVGLLDLHAEVATECAEMKAIDMSATEMNQTEMNQREMDNEILQMAGSR